MSSADPGLYPGELLAIPGSGGVFVAGDSEMSPRLVHFTSTADVTHLVIEIVPAENNSRARI